MKFSAAKVEKNILKYVVTTSLWTHFLFSSLIVLVLEVIYLSIGWLIAIPTDYGRLFALSLSIFTISIYVYSFIFFVLLKLLSLIWKDRLRTEMVLQHLFKQHSQISKRQVNPNEPYGLIKDILSIQGYKRQKVTIFVLLILAMLYILSCLPLPFIIYYFLDFLR